MNAQEVNRMLRADETILWCGKPEPFALLDRHYRPRFVKCCARCSFYTALTVAAYGVFTLFQGDPFHMLVPILAALFFGYLAVADLFDYRALARKCVYCITSERVVAFVSQAQMQEVELAQIGDVDIVRQQPGTCSVRIGSDAVSEPPERMRDLALECLGGKEPTYHCVFFNLTDSAAIVAEDLINRCRASVA